MPPIFRKPGEPLPKSFLEKFFGSKPVEQKLQADPQRAKLMDQLIAELLDRHATLTEAIKATPKGPRRAALTAEREQVTTRGKTARAAKAAAEAPPRGTAPNPEPNIGDIIPEAGPRLSTKNGRIILEMTGRKMTLDEAFELFKDRIPEAAQEITKLKEIESAIQQLPMIEGGRLASFEQAAALRAARKADPNSAHFDPNRQFKFKGKPAEAEEPRITTPGQRVARDISGSMRVPSRVEEAVSPAATKLIEKGTDAIQGMDSAGLQKTAQTILKLMGDAETLVRKKKISREVADSIRNRMVESLMKMPQGKDVIERMRAEEVRTTSGPKFLAQDAEGNLIPREEGTSLVGDAARAVGRLIGLGTRKLGPEDLAAEREGRALRGEAEQGKKRKPKAPPTREEMDRPVQWPPNIARPSAPKPERPPLLPPQIIEELAKASPDPSKIAKAFGMSEEWAINALDQFLDVRAKLRGKIAGEVAAPYLRGRKAVVQRGRVVDRLSPEELTALAEQAGLTRGSRVVPSVVRPPVSAGGTWIQDRSSRLPDENVDGWEMLQRLTALLRGGRTPFKS